MDPWCFDTLDKGFVSNEIISPLQSDSVVRSKNSLFMGLDFKGPNSYEDNLSAENSGFTELGLAEMMWKQFPADTSKNNALISDVAGADIVNPSLFTSNVVPEDEELSSKLSSSVMDSSSRESSLIDLKLGGFGDKLLSNSSRTAPSSPESSTPAKRVRATSLSSQTVYCQVYGCHKDLSSAKDYHKRHKVCDVHSKTNKVVVSGVEQRFCQQCSRFHLLGEFDDSKRSCRKRLAGHNERRRKPQVGYNNGRAERSFTYTGSVGSKYQGAVFRATSFIFQDVLSQGPLYDEKYGTNSWCTRVKIEDGANCSHKSADTCTNGQLQEKPVSSPFSLGKHYPSVNNTDNNGQENVFGDNVTQNPQEIVSRSFFQTNSLGTEDLTLFDAASTVQGFQGISESGCALSLLSSQSQNSPGHSSGLPGAYPSNIPNISPQSPHYSMNEVSEKIIGVSSQIPNGSQNGYSTYRVSSSGINNLSYMPEHNTAGTANSGFTNGILLDSEFVDAKNHLSCEDGATINLLQLSSQLQRVENERQVAPPKQDTKGFCNYRMT